jgi:hypothetical protein
MRSLIVTRDPYRVSPYFLGSIPLGIYSLTVSESVIGRNRAKGFWCAVTVWMNCHWFSPPEGEGITHQGILWGDVGGDGLWADLTSEVLICIQFILINGYTMNMYQFNMYWWNIYEFLSLQTGPRHDKQNLKKMQMHKQRQRTERGTGMNPTGRYTHVFEEKVRKRFIQNNWDPYKVEIKNPRPNPHQRKNINYFSTQRIHIFFVLQNDNTVNVFILNKENMSDLHVYTYTHTYTKIIHIYTQISYRKKKHKCCHDEQWRCRQTDELVKTS